METAKAEMGRSALGLPTMQKKVALACLKTLGADTAGRNGFSRFS